MKKHFATIALGAMTTMGVAGLCWAQAQTGGQTGQMPGQQQQQGMQQQQPGGMTGGQQQMGGQQIDQSQVRTQLARIVEAALSDRPINQLGEHVTRNQQQLLQQIDQQQQQELRGTVQAFKRDWRTRYNQDFNLTNAQQVAMANFQIMSGGLGGQAQPAGGFLQPGQQQQQQPGQLGQPGQQQQQDQQRDLMGQPRGDAGTMGQQQDQTGAGIGGSAQIGNTGVSGQAQIGDQQQTGQLGQQDQMGQQDQFGQQQQQQPGQLDLGGQAQPAGATMQPGGQQQQQNQATVMIPANPQHNLPQVTLTLVKEDHQWRLQLPAGVDANKLAQSLKNHLFVLGEQREQWPQDVNQGYTLAAHHVLAALQNQPIQPQQGGMQQQPGQQGMQGGQQQQGISPSGNVGSRTGEQSGIGVGAGQQGQQGQSGQ